MGKDKNKNKNIDKEEKPKKPRLETWDRAKIKNNDRRGYWFDDSFDEGDNDNGSRDL